MDAFAAFSSSLLLRRVGLGDLGDVPRAGTASAVQLVGRERWARQRDLRSHLLSVSEVRW